MKTPFHASRKAFSDEVLSRLIPFLERYFGADVLLTSGELDRAFRVDALVMASTPIWLSVKVRTMAYRAHGDIVLPVLLLNSYTPAEALMEDIWIFYVFADEKTLEVSEAYLFPIDAFRRCVRKVIYFPPKRMLMASVPIEEMRPWRIL